MNLRKVISTGVLTSALIAGMASSASALTISINRTSGYFSGNGGEFTVKFTSDPSLEGAAILNSYADVAKLDAGIQTFCLETSKYVTVPGSYSAAISGATQSVIDPLSKGSDYLYSLFAQGSLAEYDYTPPGRDTSAGLLQNAIWFLEGEASNLTDANAYDNNIFIKKAVDVLGGGLAGIKADSNGMYGSKVLNLTNSAGTSDNQDQIVWQRVPDGGSTLALLGLAMGGLAFIARRRKA